MSTNNQSQFDFAKFNELTDRVPVGLKLTLASSLLKGAVMSLERFENPQEQNVRAISDDLKSYIRDTWKPFADRQKAEREARIDNSTKPTPDTMENLQRQLKEQQRMIQAMLNGDFAKAQKAEQGIEEIRNGELNQTGDPQQLAA